MEKNFTYIKEILERIKVNDKCGMCGVSSYTLWFLWVGILTGDKVKVCLKCAYREEFGTKKAASLKKNKVIENYFNIM